MNQSNPSKEPTTQERVLLALKEARAKLEAVDQSQNERVAIVGMAGRFPGARDVEEFWQNLCHGTHSIQFLSDEELQSAGIDKDVLNHPNYVKAYSSLADFDSFDATFFGYSPKEAEVMDPQHRIFLECAWEALEQAGYDPEQYNGEIGVYGGASLNSYIINLHSNSHLQAATDNVQAVVSNVMGLMPPRVSYKLNLTGPSCGVQTGCSTSLVSVHLACQSLLNHECDLALAGGVSINAGGKSGYLYQADGVLSPDGYCRAFDAQGQGTVFGNGVGIVVLRRLSEAIANRDCIYAVIKGSAINNDGSQKVGLTAPSVTGQARVIAASLEKAGITPETIQYIETHGTGTALGDPIEIAALTKVFRQHTQATKFCAIGSVKTNVGHLDAAAGVAGLMKAALALKYAKIPPSLNFESPNPQIDFDNSPFYVNTQLCDWQTNETPRRGAVSSFGMGGTNAHMILEEALVKAVSSPSRSWQLLLVSAKTPKALSTATTNLVNYLKRHPDVNLADVAYTLQVGRRSLDQRRAIVCQSREQAIEILTTQDSPPTQTVQVAHQTLVFMFSGQGSQYVNMGRELYETEAVFREEVDRCCELLKPHLNLDIRQILYPERMKAEVGSGKAESSLPNSVARASLKEILIIPNLNDTAYAQPALFIIEYALAQLWMSWGIRPQAMIGHSIGEYVAATIAGVFSLEDALAIVATRGQLMQQCPPGAMLAVKLTEAELKPYLNKDLTIAAINASKMCVVSGAIAAIAQLQQSLTIQEIACRPLHTSHAFHSPMMQPVVEPFTARMRQVKLHPPQLPFISNLTGTWMTPEQATDPNYWANHLRQTVRFGDGIAEILRQPSPILLEVGPGRTLSTIANSQLEERKSEVGIPKSEVGSRNSELRKVVLTTLRHPQEQQFDIALMLNTVGQLWLAGVKIDWSRFYTQEQRQRIPLPTYPFERQRYWVELQKNDVSLQQDLKPSKKPDIADWFYLPSWKRSAPVIRSSQPTRECWLLFLDAYGLGLQIAQQLEQIGQDVIVVKAGERFSQLQDGVYAIASENLADYNTLLQHLQALGKIPQKIVHLWQVKAADVVVVFGVENSQDDNLLFEKHQDLGFYSLLFLTQALSGQQISAKVEITVVTNQLHDVVGTETINSAQTTVLGLCKVIPQEYPQIHCRNIDVVIPKASSKQFEKCVADLVTELSTPTSDLIVAYRNGYRWVQTFESLPLPKADPTTLSLRKGGVYLIAGDLVEGLGLVFAQYLAQEYHAKLILIGRPGLSEKHDWDKWLATHSQQDPISRSIQTLQGLEALGQGLLFFSADLADEGKMQAIATQAYEHFGEIHGVIHAGVMGDRASCLIQSLDDKQTEHQFRSKVHGLLVLEKVFQEKTLDFYLLQSSLSSVVGGVGFAAYAAANVFMDSLARDQGKHGSTPWISVNWDACQLETSNETTVTGSTLLDLAMTPKEVWEVTERILSRAGIAQIVVSPRDLQSRIDESTQPQIAPDAKSAATAHSYARPNLSTSYIAPQNEIEQKVADAMQELLGIERIGIHDNFFELGGHSLLAIQAVSRLREEFQVELPMRQFLFESPTVAGIAKIISENLSQGENHAEIVQLLEQIEQMEADQVKAELGNSESGISPAQTPRVSPPETLR
jgi:acyl transferase domain-containing protein